MKLELWATCIPCKIMLIICSFVCNCSELVENYTNNNWSGNFKMSDELVPKHYQDTDPHIATQLQTKRAELLRKEGGWETDRRLNESVSESSQNRPVMAIWCDWTMCPLASWHQPALLWPILPAPSCQGQTQTKKTKASTQTHIQTDFVLTTIPWKPHKWQKNKKNKTKPVGSC